MMNSARAGLSPNGSEPAAWRCSWWRWGSGSSAPGEGEARAHRLAEVSQGSSGRGRGAGRGGAAAFDSDQFGVRGADGERGAHSGEHGVGGQQPVQQQHLDQRPGAGGGPTVTAPFAAAGAVAVVVGGRGLAGRGEQGRGVLAFRSDVTFRSTALPGAEAVASANASQVYCVRALS